MLPQQIANANDRFPTTFMVATQRQMIRYQFLSSHSKYSYESLLHFMYALGFFLPLPTNCRIFIENAKHFYDNVNVLRNQLSRRRVNNRHVQIVHNQFELHIQFQDACRASRCHLQMLRCISHCLQILLLLYELLRTILYKRSLFNWRCPWFKTTNRFYLVK